MLKPVEWERFHQVMDRFRGGDGDVLVVDDGADTRLRMRTVLERNGWTVTEAANGLESLDQVAHAVPKLILLDLMMPVMSGAEFREKQLALPRIARIPVIVMSAADRGGVIAARLQVSDFLSKPPNVNVLLDTIARYC